MTGADDEHDGIGLALVHLGTTFVPDRFAFLRNAERTAFVGELFVTDDFGADRAERERTQLALVLHQAKNALAATLVADVEREEGLKPERVLLGLVWLVDAQLMDRRYSVLDESVLDLLRTEPGWRRVSRHPGDGHAQLKSDLSTTMKSRRWPPG